MPTFLRKIILETSAINALEADKDLGTITQSLGIAYRIRIPETTLSEVIACRSRDACARPLVFGARSLKHRPSNAQKPEARRQQSYL